MLFQKFYQFDISIKNIIASMSIPKQSPLKRKISTISLSSSFQNGGEQTSKRLDRAKIQVLIQKFNNVNGSIDIEADQTNLNLIQYQRQNSKIKYDAQMISAKLRRLENKAQVKRAEMELDNRLKRKLKKVQKNLFTKEQSYATIYNRYIKGKKNAESIDDLSDDDSVENLHQKRPVAYYSQLKRHPKLLQYTLQKIKVREGISSSARESLDTQIQSYRKSVGDRIPSQYKQIFQEQAMKDQQQKQSNPQEIVDKKISKFFTKKSSGDLTKEIRQIPRLSKMMKKQSKIVSDIDERSLSNENKKKLKSKLNEIIFSIGKSERMRQGNISQTITQKSGGFLLPKINSFKNQSYLESHRYN